MIIIRWIRSINWTPDAIIAAATIALAFLTLVLAIGTFFLWMATRQLVIDAERTSERQLRAYVLNRRGVISNIIIGGIPEVEIEMQNWGQTPAYKVEHNARITFATFPQGKLPPPPEALSQTTVAPGAIFYLIVKMTKPLDSAYITGLKRGSLAIYVNGTVKYIDAFAQKRWTNYRLIYGGARGIPPNDALFSDIDGNDAN